MPFIETADGTTISTRDWGDGPPVVFLAGWALSSVMWQHQMVDLVGAGFRCVAYDRRGHGRSDDPGRGYDYDTLADDLGTVLDALDLRGATVVAHSMAGGEVVRHLTRSRSSRIDKVALIAATLPYPALPVEVGEAVRAEMGADLAGWARDGADAFLGAGLDGNDVCPEQADWLVRDLLGVSLQAALACNRTMLETDFTAELADVGLPVLLVHGTADASIPLEISSARTVELLADARLEVYEHGPHGLFLTHRARLREDLLAFAKG